MNYDVMLAIIMVLLVWGYIGWLAILWKTDQRSVDPPDKKGSK